MNMWTHHGDVVARGARVLAQGAEDAAEEHHQLRRPPLRPHAHGAADPEPDELHPAAEGVPAPRHPGRVLSQPVAAAAF